MSKLFEKTRKWKWFTLIAVVIAIAVVAGTISVIALAAGPDSQEEPPTPTPTVAPPPPPPPNGPAGQITLEDLAKIRPSKAALGEMEKHGETNEPRKEREIEIAGKKVKLPADAYATPRTCMSIEYPSGYSFGDDNRDALLISRGDSYIWIDGNTGEVSSGRVSPGKKGEEVFDFLIDAFPDQSEAIRSPHTAVKPKGINSDNITTITIPLEVSPQSVEVSR